MDIPEETAMGNGNGKMYLPQLIWKQSINYSLRITKPKSLNQHKHYLS